MSGTSSCFFCKNVDFKKLTQYWGIGHTSSLPQPFFFVTSKLKTVCGESITNITP